MGAKGRFMFQFAKPCFNMERSPSSRGIGELARGRALSGRLTNLFQLSITDSGPIAGFGLQIQEYSVHQVHANPRVQAPGSNRNAAGEIMRLSDESWSHCPHRVQQPPLAELASVGLQIQSWILGVSTKRTSGRNSTHPTRHDFVTQACADSNTTQHR